MIAGYTTGTHLDETENFEVCIDNKINVGKWYDARALRDTTVAKEGS